jgi:hypothetical protein|tara:strand:+ start:673 stop:1251 length:579 start_codon:yes stop_codon:yes gene_type:complete
MELYWTHLQQDKRLKCIINDSLYYICIDGGRIIQKVVDGEVVDYFTNEKDDNSWEVEKRWLGNTHREITGRYKPKDFSAQASEHIWRAKHEWYKGATPMFGITGRGTYLDRLQRSQEMQTGADMIFVIKEPKHKLFIEKDSDGNYYRRLWCEEQDVMYNVQPCCVFPQNPGRQLLTTNQLNRLLEEHGLTLP